MAQTTARHQELLKKVETLNALTDSNRMLREEKDRLDQQVQQLEAKVGADPRAPFRSEYGPLQSVSEIT